MAREWEVFSCTDDYYSRVWHVLPQTGEFCIIQRADTGKLFVSERAVVHQTRPDVGPFETFEAAAACFETLAGLD